jgi:GTP-binding protein EngB required for normal cell division
MSEVQAILNRISALANELKLANLHPQIAACRSRFNGHHGIDVAVFGRFKAGKSSFLNSLTGRAVLPIGVVPVTAVVTRLRYGPLEKAEVRFLDGTANAVPLEEIGLYVGEDANPNNEKRVASVDVELPALKGLEPLRFVDTPGLGSAFTHNTQVTLQWLPNVGAALVAVSCDAPLSEPDLTLLEQLRLHTPKIVLLLTKADLLTPSQRNEVLAFVRRQLSRKWGTELPVFFYSVRPEEVPLKTELEQNLFLPLIQNRDQAAGQIARHKLLSLVSQVLNYLQVALAAATQAESARQALRESLAEERRQFDLLRAELNVLAREWSANALDWSLAQLLPIQRGLEDKITTGLGAQFPRWRLRLPPLMVAWRDWINQVLNRELSEISRAQQDMFRSPLHRARQHLTRTLRAFHDRLADHARAALGVSLTPPEFALEVAEPSAPPLDVAYALDPFLMGLGHLVPMTLFGALVCRALLRKARWEVEKNISRLAAEWRDRVTAGINELTRQAEKQAMDELTALEQLAESSASKAPELQQAIEELAEVRDGLHASPEPEAAEGVRLNVSGAEGAGVSPAPFSATSLPSPRKK